MDWIEQNKNLICSTTLGDYVISPKDGYYQAHLLYREGIINVWSFGLLDDVKKKCLRHYLRQLNKEFHQE